MTRPDRRRELARKRRQRDRNDGSRGAVELFDALAEIDADQRPPADRRDRGRLAGTSGRGRRELAGSLAGAEAASPPPTRRAVAIVEERTAGRRVIAFVGSEATGKSTDPGRGGGMARSEPARSPRPCRQASEHARSRSLPHVLLPALRRGVPGAADPARGGAIRGRRRAAGKTVSAPLRDPVRDARLRAPRAPQCERHARERGRSS